MKERITITIDKAILERLEKMAEAEQRSLSGLINRLLTKVLKVIEPSKRG